MRSITTKPDTWRAAVAEAVLRATPAAIERLRQNDLPKKDVLPTARAAGVLAAKKTPTLIPDCHPIPLDEVSVEFEVRPDSVRVEARVETVWKTGVEMEALAAVSVAALTLYDMLKPIEKNMEITGVRLLSKQGGKSTFKDGPPPGFTAAVVVTSDGTFQGARQDKSGRIIQQALESHGLKPQYAVLPDDKDKIAAKLRELCDSGVALVLTTGGTGLGPRDVTVEATREVIDREIPGILEAGRAFGQRRTPYAMLSRGIAGQKGKTIIINLPGSSKGTSETLAAIFPSIFHAYPMMAGGGHG